ncbi:hypothetical protein ACFL2Q_04660, partial [Thermodesulfobacteriota bacterium]
ADSQPVELLWVGGRLEQVGDRDLRTPGQVSFESSSGGTTTVVGQRFSSSQTLQMSYKGPDDNVFTFQAAPVSWDGNAYVADGSPTFTLDGKQIERGQDATVMGPDGRISVQWGVPSHDLPDGSGESGTDSGLAVFGVNRDVQVVPIEQDGHSAWVINNTRVISPYTYLSKLQSGEVAAPAAVTTDEVAWSQVVIASNEAEAVDTTTTVQAEVEVEALIFAFGVAFLT